MLNCRICKKQGRKDSIEDDKLRIVQLAAQMILEDITDSPCKSSDTNPSIDNIEERAMVDLLPTSLKVLLAALIGKKHQTKIGAIGQSLMQAARPNSLLMPFPLYLSVHLHSRFGSRYLVEKLSQFGFCKGYNEALCFEKNAAVVSESRSLEISSEQTMEFGADNVDDDPASLDGSETIHMLGMIVGLTPSAKQARLLVLQNTVNNTQIRELSSNLIFKFNSEGVKKLGGLIYLDYPTPDCQDRFIMLDLIWKCKQLVPIEAPLWSGLMQAAFGISEAVQKSAVVFLPFIDLHSTDLNCVYSTLKYVSNVARRNDRLPVCTFDQAL